MTISKMIMEYEPFIKKIPIKLSKLTEYINSYSKKQYTKTAIRNVFLNEYYNFGYKTFDWGIYAPKKVNNFIDFINILFNGLITPTWITLLSHEGLHNQNFSHNYFLCFGNFVTKEYDYLIIKNNTFYIFDKKYEKYKSEIKDLILVKNSDDILQIANLLKNELNYLLKFLTETYRNVYLDMKKDMKVLSKDISFIELRQDKQNKILPNPEDYELIGKIYKGIIDGK